MERKFEHIKHWAINGMMCHESAWRNFWLPKLKEVYKMGLEKPKRQKDRSYLDDVVYHTECLVKYSPLSTPCAGKKTPAHLKTRGSGGSDYQVICLCLKHHTEQGSMPLKDFEEKYQINVWKEALENLLRFKL